VAARFRDTELRRRTSAGFRPTRQIFAKGTNPAIDDRLLSSEDIQIPSIWALVRLLAYAH
jgi:hypothetical protein